MTHGEISRSKSVDIDKMISAITREINSFWSLYDHGGDGAGMCQLYRVPEHIRMIDRIAYEPIVVSFGPNHCGADNLRDMEKDKWEHLDRVLKLNSERSLHDYIKATSVLEKQARKCYTEEIKMERKKFVQMLLLDTCFILVNIDENVGTTISNSRVLEQSSSHIAMERDMIDEALTNLSDSSDVIRLNESKEHAYASQGQDINIEVEIGSQRPLTENNNHVRYWLGCAIWHDMFLLENQIPFFIVERIYELVAGQDSAEALRNKTAEFVEDILRQYPKAIQELNRPKHFHHLLHLCHMYFRPSQRIAVDHHMPKLRWFHRLLHVGYKYLPVGHKRADVEENLDQQVDCFQAGKLRTRWRRAVEYHRAGIQFKTREYDGQSMHSLLDIRFMDGIIEVPRFPIDESTESLFKNLVALEQTDPRIGNDFSAYVTFMSQVIATPDDATMLVQRGIIVHMLDSDEEVSDLVTRITKQVSFRFYGKYYLKSLCQTLEAHYQSRLNRWIAWMWLNYFGNPWLALAALAGAVVLACTIVQTVYTVLAYVKPPPGT